MKKTLALVLAGVMAAGMTTVAFAVDQAPVIGQNGDRAYVIDSEDVASTGLDAGRVLEGGDEIAIPIYIWEEGTGYHIYDRDFDYNTKNVKAYGDWDDVEGDAEGELDLRWVKYNDAAANEFDSAAGFYYSVVITVPENNGDKALDLVGKVSVGRTSNAARNADDSVTVETVIAPDKTLANYKIDFDGGMLTMGETGIVGFDKDAGEIDIEFGDDALFIVDVDGQSRLNLAWNKTFDKEFSARYDYANLDFITFEGTPRFNRTGDFYLYADEDAFIYKKGAEGVEEINGLEWDPDYEAWHFRTRELGAYVISDVELDEQTVTEDKDDTTTEDGNKQNPDTGR